ncbi:uncharacterized protein BT62DRAFT_1034137 [Guyanagaster necrorhizus]|uniref:RlpA-like protein double-psi beta-barrel domain-containing protein n=1 Tax=Guyanagaster necrorhizus TaxID=856835 RepID=A0A9P8API4_9AGAR|nr:uncharacterized protein BT62DRAFT_1034137 [Guyanagaster necrorhizus MCA 3950]KAG7443373.1 hypothetical protein BT62DRAFT_1034137 [Guyanagaster necrorhizus MCA 3950]
MLSLKYPVLAVIALSIGTVNAIIGDATWYTPNGDYGACGAPLQNSDYIVALASNQYAGGARCWKHISASYRGNFVNATVGDLCPGCRNNQIDLSSTAFKKLAHLDIGLLHHVTWYYYD